MSITTEELIQKVKIEDIVKEYVLLKQRGANYLGICPFHYEKSPSFTVSPTKQIYKCFGCGKSGNVISFLMDIENVNFQYAVKLLSNKVKSPEPERETSLLNSGSIDSYSSNILRPILINLNSNIQSISELMNFDRSILDFCILQLELLDSNIKENKEIQITNVRFFPTNTLIQLKNIKQNQSFISRYGTIYNQCIVLLISYMTSSLTEIFKETFKYLAKNHKSKIQGASTELKLTIEELAYVDFNLTDSIGDFILKKKNVSFQDMQSTLKEFQNYFGVKFERNKNIDNIILAQAARHSIVHSLAIADEKFINQVKQTSLRTIKNSIELNDEIQFSIDEIEEVVNDIKEFIGTIAKKLIELIESIG